MTPGSGVSTEAMEQEEQGVKEEEQRMKEEEQRVKEEEQRVKEEEQRVKDEEQRLREEKRRLKEEKVRAREMLTAADRKVWSERICRSILSLPAYRNARTVMLYKFLRGEVQLKLLEQENETLPETLRKRFVYPLCLPERKMKAICPGGPDEESGAWKRGSFGISEPDPEQGEEIPPSEIDLVICPLTAFDGAGRRLGMGGGYYDRFLPLCRNARIIGAAFEVQRVPGVPAGSFDVPMELIVTETGIHRPADP